MMKTWPGVTALMMFAVIPGASNARAAAITWTLQSVAFTDGGTASGSFAYDASSNVYTNINIATTATGGIPATLFQFKSVFGTAPSVGVFLDSGAANLTGFHDLTLRFATDLTNAGGTSALLLSNGSFETTCSNAMCGSVTAPTSYITAGRVTTGGAATPEPATLSLIPLGLAAIYAARRRSQS
jgi:hypothetical protein